MTTKGMGGRAGHLSGRARSPWAVALMIFATGCTAPTMFAVDSPAPMQESFSCIMDALVDYDFRIVDARRADGIIKAERPKKILGFISQDSWDILDVVMFEGRDGGTVVQYTAGTLEMTHEGPELSGPSDEVEAIANEIADLCSG